MVTYFSIGGLFIDDIVFPDGRTTMNVLGGGCIHAAAAIALWDERAGLATIIGNNLDPGIRARLERDFDTTGLITVPYPQARAWQLFEWDGKRTELWRVDTMDPFLHDPQPENVSPAYDDARGVFLLRDTTGIEAWRARYPKAVLFWEPTQHYMLPENTDGYRAALPVPDIVSPNLLEARLIYGDLEPDALIDTMLSDGAKVVALRMGEDGSLVANSTARVRVPAVDVPEIVDVTGAGNTYCGGFLHGYVSSGGNLRTAGYFGAVAASFALERIGVIDPTEIDRSVRDARLAALVNAGS